jgi:hypothetical protein
MNRFAFLLALPLLAGCNVHSKNPNDSGDNVSIHADENGDIAFNLPIAEGQVKVPSGFMHNGDVDIDGVKLPAGSSVTGFNLDSHNDVSNVDMSFIAPGSPDQVRSYFVDAFKKQGVEAALSGDAVSGKSKDGSPFTITVVPGSSGSQGKIVLQDKDKD